MMTPGYKTSEFWLTVASLVIGLLVSTRILPTDTDVQNSANSIVSGIVIIYTISRAVVKWGTVRSMPTPPAVESLPPVE